jgi:hypothetical protein
VPEPFLQELTKLLGVFAIPVAVLIWAIAWLMKCIITHTLSKDITRLSSESTREIEQMKIQSAREIEQMKIQLLHEAELLKIQLNTKSTEEIEQLKSKLSIFIKEHEIKFSGLHEERANVIKSLRSKIITAKRVSEWFSTKINLAIEEGREGGVSDNEIIESLRELFEDAWNKTDEALTYGSEHSIYFSRDLSERIHNLIDMLESPSSTFAMWSHDPKILVGLYKDKQRDQLKWQREINDLLGVIEDEFRSLLGVNNTI